MNPRRLMAIDPSLTCSGWALFDLRSERIVAVGKVRSQPPRVALTKRLLDLQGKIGGVFDSITLGPADLLVCEAPTTMRDPKAAIKVEQVRGIFETVARARGTLVPGRINPRTVHKEILGLSGPQLARAEVKMIATHTVSRLFASDLERLGIAAHPESLAQHQDIVDAILLGYLGVTRVRTATRLDEVELEPLFSRPTRRRVASLR